MAADFADLCKIGDLDRLEKFVRSTKISNASGGIDEASKNGHTHVLDWIKQSVATNKIPLHYGSNFDNLL